MGQRLCAATTCALVVASSAAKGASASSGEGGATSSTSWSSSSSCGRSLQLALLLSVSSAASASGSVSAEAQASAVAAAEEVAKKRAAAAKLDFDTRSEAVTQPLKVTTSIGGGGRCELDVECGWYEPRFTAAQRRDLPSGNGARCLVGRCVCANAFDGKYGCPRCSVQLRQTFSYSDEGMEITSKIRGTHGTLLDLCDFPSGGGPCNVGKCIRDEYGKILECPGDFECDAAGSGSGICVGDDHTTGFCVCGKGYFCGDCSLHETDLVAGAICDRYITGGAFCHGDTDCGPDVAGYCAVPKWLPSDDARETLFDRVANLLDHVVAENRPFCKCEPGWTCRRCEKPVSELEKGGTGCNCDAPIFQPNGGVFDMHHVEVDLVSPPWDSGMDCKVYYEIQKIDEVPMAPLYSSTRAASEALVSHGKRLVLHEDDSEQALVLEYDYTEAHSKMGRNVKRPPPQIYVIFAVAIPRSNLTLLMNASTLVASEVFIINAARQQGAPPHLFQFVLAGLPVLLLLAAPNRAL